MQKSLWFIFTMATMMVAVNTAHEHNASAGEQSKLFRVLTYNIWGITVPTETAPWRYAEIADRISNYDLVAIQEAWSSKTKILLESKEHPYHAFGARPFHLIGGSGLVVLSKYPIVETHFRAFHDCSQLECTAQKGVLFTRIEIAPGQQIDVYTTHVNAWESYDLIRTSQILDLVGMIHDYTIANPILVLGDFNADYGTINYDEIKGNLTLNDSYEVFASRQKNPTPELLHGYTYDVERNPWAAPSLSNEDHPQRLDYIFYRDSWNLRMRLKEASLAFTEAVRDGKPLSDHYGVSTLFQLIGH